MQLATPQSAILSAVIFNALVIVALIPLALRGVRFRPSSSDRLLRRNLLVYGLGGVVVPFVGIFAHRPRRPARPGDRLTAMTSTTPPDKAAPAGRAGLARGAGHRPAAAPPGRRPRSGCCSSSPCCSASSTRRSSGASHACPDCTRTPRARCSAPRRQLLPHRHRPGARRTRPPTPGSTPAPRPRRPTTRSPGLGPADATTSGGSNLGAAAEDLRTAVEERRATIAARDGVDPAAVPPDALTASGSGLDPHISPEYAALQVPRVARVTGPAGGPGPHAGRRRDRPGATLGFLGRAPGERARAQRVPPLGGSADPVGRFRCRMTR